VTSEQISKELEASFERLVEIVQIVGGHDIRILSDIWGHPIGDHLLSDWLFDPSLGLDRTVTLALQAALGRMPNWDGILDRQGLSDEVAIDGELRDAISVSAAMAEMAASRAVACLSALPMRRGPKWVEAPGAAAFVHFITDLSDMLNFFREIPEIENLDEKAFLANAEFAFPGIYFVRDKVDFGKFDETYASIRLKVSSHLAVLNDHAKEVLCSGDTAAQKALRLKALGVVASGENSTTKGNRKAIAERNVEVDGCVITCDWHTKVRPHLDRIYFNATSHKSVVVGIFSSHLL
jgi:hypothetical protein